ncbi:MAG: hypothetical protein AABY06_02585 [Nanoarchaeota archaeon]
MYNKEKIGAIIGIILTIIFIFILFLFGYLILFGDSISKLIGGAGLILFIVFMTTRDYSEFGLEVGQLIKVNLKRKK